MTVLLTDNPPLPAAFDIQPRLVPQVFARERC